MSKAGTIFDYLSWRGDLTFEERPFNIVDNVVLTFLTYAMFDKVKLSAEENHQGYPLNEYYKMLLQAGGYPKGDILCSLDELRQICESKRFGSVILSDYIDIIDTSKDIQFAAEIFHISPSEEYISFRGTDDTLAGWKEDMQLSYKKVPAQYLAWRYLEEHVTDKNVTYYVGGHSKGANLAIYAASHLSKDKYRYIKHVYMNDGPGFCPDVMDPKRLREIDDKTIFIGPTYEIIGAVFYYPFTHSYIVKSCFKGILQHNAKSWLVTGDELYTAERYDPESVNISRAIAMFVNDTTLEDREKFVNSFFDSFSEKGKYKLLSEAKTSEFRSIQKRFIALGSRDKETKSTLARIPLTFLFSNTLMKFRHTKPMDFIIHNSLPLGLVMIALGVALYFIPFVAFPYVIGASFMVMMLVELSLLIYFLILTKGNVKGQLIRLTVVVILAALSISYFVNSEAIGAFSCIILGILLLILSFSMLGKLLDQAYEGLNIPLAMMEIVALLAGGMFFIISNDYEMEIIKMIIAWLCIADGIVKSLMGLYQVFADHRPERG